MTRGLFFVKQTSFWIIDTKKDCFFQKYYLPYA